MDSVFDKMSQEILTLAVEINGTDQLINVLDEILYRKSDKDDRLDPEICVQRLESLPAKLAFYGVLKDEASQKLERMEDEFRVWFYLKSSEVKSSHNLVQSGLKTSLQKALTVKELETEVAAKNIDQWREWREKLGQCKSNVSNLDRILDSLRQAIIATTSAGRIIQAMMTQGLQGSSFSKAKPLSQSRYSGVHPE